MGKLTDQLYEEIREIGWDELLIGRGLMPALFASVVYGASAQFLGIAPADFLGAWNQGKTIGDLVQYQNITHVSGVISSIEKIADYNHEEGFYAYDIHVITNEGHQKVQHFLPFAENTLHEMIGKRIDYSEVIEGFPKMVTRTMFIDDKHVCSATYDMKGITKNWENYKRVT